MGRRTALFTVCVRPNDRSRIPKQLFAYAQMTVCLGANAKALFPRGGRIIIKTFKYYGKQTDYCKNISTFVPSMNKLFVIMAVL